MRYFLVFCLVTFCATHLCAEPEFRRALPGYTYDLPRDHGSHPDFQTEWWYYTGNLADAEGRPFGYELTIFRFALTPPGSAAAERSPLSPGQIYLGHFAISDIQNRKHQFWEQIGREGLGQASASTETLDVRVGSLSIRMLDNGNMRLVADSGDAALNLLLEPVKPPVMHGKDGVHQKSDGSGEASHYISFTRMNTSGEIILAGGRHSVNGLSWMDHEYFTNSLSSEEVGWDWFALQLDSGEDIMVYQLRRADGSYNPQSSGTLVLPDGGHETLPGDVYTIEATGEWKSPESGAVYPMGWTIDFPQHEGKLTIKPTFPEQEMRTERFTGVIYWEGAVTIEGTWKNEPASGRGYVELVGYHKAFRGNPQQ